jgi:hypothetical protein
MYLNKIETDQNLMGKEGDFIFYNHIILLVMCTFTHVITSLHQYAFKFTFCFIRFWMKLKIFTMVKVGNLLINKDKLLQTSEFINN